MPNSKAPQNPETYLDNAVGNVHLAAKGREPNDDLKAARTIQSVWVSNHGQVIEFPRWDRMYPRKVAVECSARPPGGVRASRDNTTRQADNICSNTSGTLTIRTSQLEGLDVHQEWQTSRDPTAGTAMFGFPSQLAQGQLKGAVPLSGWHEGSHRVCTDVRGTEGNAPNELRIPTSKRRLAGTLKPEWDGRLAPDASETRLDSGRS